MTLRKKRTKIDFSDHELIIRSNGDGDTKIFIYDLKKSNTVAHRVKFINTNGICIVIGDFGRWSFCREFHPSEDGYVSDSYWIEKLHIMSSQKGKSFDVEETLDILENGIDGELEDNGYEDDELNEMKIWYEDLLSYVYDESEYKHRAYSTMPSFIDFDDVPYVTKIDHWLLIIFDAFEEICDRLNKKQIEE